MIKALIFSVGCLFLLNTGVNQCYANGIGEADHTAVYSDVIDNEMAQELLDAYQLVRERKRADSMALIDTITAKLDQSVPMLESTFKRLKRVKINVRQREWYRAISIFKGILKDLSLL
ncbi:MAG: hypothetical protein A2381_01790 [Bdellovibrionales bacterium RIFOXYB1_FULL_37_110]|nr:MAG: hypothetical protein A2417_15725 [Bdellovibrionales bacterium RIFOXYC1_FULL_37_79]OFZ58947.1 MAG: hypothetical protein A2381_01790 [Bdellovibrionales bacterium RIFOXYB1_FULL_37_110]OFZ64607.1 MAG: hypothetical protein A2577_13145 [Bdellovibrionales bacterium RIFOXYD1_FULL_36_51]